MNDTTSGTEIVQKRYLITAVAPNLGDLMRKVFGAGTARSTQRMAQAILATLLSTYLLQRRTMKYCNQYRIALKNFDGRKSLKGVSRNCTPRPNIILCLTGRGSLRARSAKTLESKKSVGFYERFCSIAGPCCHVSTETGILNYSKWPNRRAALSGFFIQNETKGRSIRLLR